MRINIRKIIRTKKGIAACAGAFVVTILGTSLIVAANVNKDDALAFTENSEATELVIDSSYDAEDVVVGTIITESDESDAPVLEEFNNEEQLQNANVTNYTDLNSMKNEETTVLSEDANLPDENAKSAEMSSTVDINPQGNSEEIPSPSESGNGIVKREAHMYQYDKMFSNYIDGPYWTETVFVTVKGSPDMANSSVTVTFSTDNPTDEVFFSHAKSMDDFSLAGYQEFHEQSCTYRVFEGYKYIRIDFFNIHGMESYLWGDGCIYETIFDESDSQWKWVPSTKFVQLY